MFETSDMFSRRSWLRSTACGFGSLAAAGLSSQPKGVLASGASIAGPHFAPRAKRIIFLFMQGGVSQVDSFDHKPVLVQRDGEMHGFDDAREFARNGELGAQQRVMNSPWKFQQYGESGRWVSELFPKTAAHVDDLCFVHSMHTDGVAHGPSTLFLHCGSTNFIRPSFGSWVLYGLGSENENLPGFVSISPSLGNGGPRNYGNAFLPAIYQGTPIGSANPSSKELSIRNLTPTNGSKSSQREQLDLLQSINQAQLKERGKDSEWEAVIESYELAWRMQSVAPSVLDLADESAETLAMYGIGEDPTDNYGRKCLLARRLCESGVRFIQVNYGDNSANPAWDQHSNLPKHADHAKAVDQPIAGLLSDLKQRGLLDDTIVWWGGEFGRTPYAQKNGTGRDHNPAGFTVWLAGGGIRPGFAYGETDEFGQKAIVDKVHMHDLHATLLHMLGLDHERLTYRYAGRNFRLTDVHGRVVKSILS
ncbi:MAG: DUF1501 domain-containing protein [Pirellulaceae bacterium]|nr:DUF1501 domain-containing protein [Pirellulaceae bacterium]